MSTTAHFTLLQYDRMVKAGVFETPTRQRIEFIRGEIREMSPIGPPHASIVDWLMEWSVRNAPQFRVRVQHPLRIPAEQSELQPDIAWLRRGDYYTRHPEPEDVVLVIEVADSSLDFDRDEKAAIYAAAGIQDYWIVNVADRAIEVFRKPNPGQFQETRVFRGEEAVSPLAIPELALRPSMVWAA